MDPEKIIELYKMGYSLAKLSAKSGYTRKSLPEFLKENDVTLRTHEQATKARDQFNRLKKRIKNESRTN